jgi:hypothetical protein
MNSKLKWTCLYIQTLIKVKMKYNVVVVVYKF